MFCDSFTPPLTLGAWAGAAGFAVVNEAAVNTLVHGVFVDVRLHFS